MTEETAASSASSGRRLVDKLLSWPGRSFHLGLIVGALITVAVAILIVQNGESAQIDWLFLHFTSPLWIILFITTIAGGAVLELTKLMIRRGRNRSTPSGTTHRRSL